MLPQRTTGPSRERSPASRTVAPSAAGSPGHLLLFAVMCGFWGLTWIAIKAGVEAVPPLFFAASRFIAAGLLLLAWARWRGLPLAVAASNALPLIGSALLVNTACYGFLFWGMRHVPSGFAAVINLSLIPILLFVFGLLLRQDRFSRRRAEAIGLGVGGLALLLGARVAVEPSAGTALGAAAIVAATAAYCLGSVLSRPLLRGYAPEALAGLQCLLGGLGLAVLAGALEPVGVADYRALLAPPVLASWAFLVVGGSIVAFTIYLKLIRDWGPAAAGTYAFVSPVIAVVAGIAAFGETYSLIEAAGAAALLLATFLALRRPPAAAGASG